MAQYAREWARGFEYGEQCMDHEHRELVLSNGVHICPCIYWARICRLIMERRGVGIALTWMEDNPLEGYIKCL